MVTRATVQQIALPEFHSNYHLSDLYGEDSDSSIQVHDVVFGAAKSSEVQFQVIGNMGFANGNAPLTEV